jgi:oxalyl-CoA decarboxylase
MSSEQSSLSSVLESLASNLAGNGIREIFGIVGDPITPLVQHSEHRGIRYYGFRNEQAASYASGAVYFLHNRVAATLTVAGPGFSNALPGMANATMNGWASLLICPLQVEPGRFQAMDQLSPLKSFFKGYVVYDPERGDESVRTALSMAKSHRPGAVSLFVPVGRVDIPRVVRFTSPLTKTVDESFVHSLPSRTLVVLGAQVATAPDLHQPVREYIDKHRIPFLPESLARGIIPESHALCVTAARSTALATCEAVIFLGTCPDWMWGFGNSQRWKNPNKSAQMHVVDVERIPGLLSSAPPRISPEWVNVLQITVQQNKDRLVIQKLTTITHTLPNHWQAIGCIREWINRHQLADSLIISEGANTMDVARVALDQISRPNRRIDAGRWGVMGGALGYLIAACVTSQPTDLSVAILGDSAFGFAGMELETLVRYKCKALVIIFNNGGIYTGTRENATAFSPSIKHDLLMESLGGFGLSTRGGKELSGILDEAVSRIQNGTYPVLVEVLIDPSSGTVSGSLSRM